MFNIEYIHAFSRKKRMRNFCLQMYLGLQSFLLSNIRDEFPRLSMNSWFSKVILDSQDFVPNRSIDLNTLFFRGYLGTLRNFPTPDFQ